MNWEKFGRQSSKDRISLREFRDTLKGVVKQVVKQEQDRGFVLPERNLKTLPKVSKEELDKIKSDIKNNAIIDNYEPQKSLNIYLNPIKKIKTNTKGRSSKALIKDHNSIL